ncbi:hypothetical protein STEG23_013575 [Scotinomys teguina]
MEPFSDFVARMVEVAGRISGDPDTAMPLIKQLDQQDPVWVPEHLVRRIPEDRKAEDVASMDDVRSAEPAVVDDIGPAVPPNGDRA